MRLRKDQLTNLVQKQEVHEKNRVQNEKGLQEQHTLGELLDQGEDINSFFIVFFFFLFYFNLDD